MDPAKQTQQIAEIAMNHYAAALRIISDEIVDWRGLVIKIAIHNPAAVTAAYARLNPGPSLEARCKQLMVSDEKIKAIKLWREETGVSIGDAIKALEAL
jgi:ribosomal protein L7/L12